MVNSVLHKIRARTKEKRKIKTGHGRRIWLLYGKRASWIL